MRGNLLFVAIGGFALGVALRTEYPVGWSVIPACVIAAAFGGGVFLLTHNYRALAFSLFICFAVLGGIRTSYVRTSIPDVYKTFINTQVIVDGTIVAPPDMRATGNRLTLEILRKGIKTRIIAVAPTYLPVRIGERVEASGKLELPEPFATDGGRMFAYDKYLAKDGVFATIQPAHVKIIAPAPTLFPLAYTPPYPNFKRVGVGAWYGMWGWLLDLNSLTQKKIQAAIPQPYAALAIGLLLGGKQGLGKDLLNLFTVVGLLQIVVLSGYNVTIVADAVLAAFSRFPKRVRLVLAAATVCAFVLAAGGGSSAVRAALMSLLSLFARATNRTGDALRALCIALFCMILYNPLLLVYDPGFQLSFLATIGIVMGSPLLQMRMLWIKSNFMRELIGTTSAAQLAVLPMLLYQSGNLSLVAIPANMLTAPAVPAAMALSAIAALVAFVVSPLAPIAGLPAFASLWYIVDVAALLARLPFAQIILPSFPFWIVLLCYAALAWITWWLFRNPPIEALRRPRSRSASQPHPS